MNHVEPLVSICMPTYQHQPFIGQAIDGVLRQQCTFTKELLLYDDASTDGTQEICRQYASANPEIVFLENDKNLGITSSAARLFLAAKGKYIAICEGDDFWVDPEKLQKQVTFLEAHPGHTIAASNARLISGDGLTIRETNLPGGDFTIDNFRSGNYLGASTASIVFRKDCIDIEAMSLLALAPYLDWALSLVCLRRGPGHCFSEVMTVYRRHSLGAWSSMTEEEQQGGIQIMQDFVSRILS